MNTVFFFVGLILLITGIVLFIDKTLRQRSKDVGLAGLVSDIGLVLMVSSTSPLPVLFIVGGAIFGLGLGILLKVRKTGTGNKKRKMTIGSAMLMAGAIMMLSSYAPLAATPHDVSASRPTPTPPPPVVSAPAPSKPVESIPVESAPSATEEPDGEKVHWFDGLVGAWKEGYNSDTIDDSDEKAQKAQEEYLSAVSKNANDMSAYTLELFSFISDERNFGEKFEKKVHNKVLVIRDCIDDLRALTAPDGMEDVEAAIASATSSYYAVTVDVEAGVKSMDGMLCSRNAEAAGASYDALVAVIEQYQ